MFASVLLLSLDVARHLRSCTPSPKRSTYGRPTVILSSGRAQLAADKLRAKVPLGVDAPNKTTRKVIGGAGSLLKVLRYGFIGLLCVFLGSLFVWAGSNGQKDLKVIGTGVVVVAFGIFALNRAWVAWKILKAISRA